MAAEGMPRKPPRPGVAPPEYQAGSVRVEPFNLLSDSMHGGEMGGRSRTRIDRAKRSVGFV